MASREAEVTGLRWFLLENYRDSSALKGLVHRRFCVRHVEALLAAAGPQLSVTVEYLARAEEETLRRFRDGLVSVRERSWFRPWRRRRLPERAQFGDRPHLCPFCDAGATAAVVAVSDVLALLDDPRGRAAYRKREGLCRPHLWMALREAADGVADWLAEDMQQRLGGAGEDLERYFDYLSGRDAGYLGRQPWMQHAHALWGEGLRSEHVCDMQTPPARTGRDHATSG